MDINRAIDNAVVFLKSDELFNLFKEYFNGDEDEAKEALFDVLDDCAGDGVCDEELDFVDFTLEAWTADEDDWAECGCGTCILCRELSKQSWYEPKKTHIYIELS